MDILYFGTMCSEQLEKKILKIVKSTGNAAQNNLERAFMQALNKRKKEYIVTAYCIPCMPYEVLGNKFYEKAEKDQVFDDCYTKTYRVIKIPVVKYISYFFETILHIWKWCRKSQNKNKIIYITVNFVPVSSAVYIMKKIYKYKTVAMVSDLAEDQFLDGRIKEFGLIRRCVIPIYSKVAQKLEREHDGFVFLADAMKFINKENKPFVVMEGIFNNNLVLKKQEVRENVILYAGALNEKYGIDKILEVMQELDDTDIILEVYGEGECKQKILEKSKIDKRIVYKGFVNREELFERMQSVKVLINLRNPKLNYTKYSFPSKMFEYMASGTPVLTTKLEGIPEEYYQYIYVVNSYDTNAIVNELREILNNTDVILNEKGLEARNFILNNKTGDSQINKVLELLRNIG